MYHAGLTVHVILLRLKRNGVFAASGGRPAGVRVVEHLHLGGIMRCWRSRSAADSTWSETTWNTVGMVTLPAFIIGECLITP